MNTLSRRDMLKAGAGLAMSPPFMGIGSVRAAERDQRPNILMIVADDQRWDTLAGLGNPHIRTPNYDRLIREGHSCTNARIMVGNCGAVCIPARATLHTGRTVFHVSLNIGDHPMLTEVFGKSGYRTFATGKWHNGAASLIRGFQDGDNIFLGGMHDQYKTPLHHWNPQALQSKKKDTYTLTGRFSSEVFTDAAVNFLDKQTGDKPFFCYIAFTSPHDPRTPPPPFNTMYAADAIPLPKNFMPRHPFDNGELKIRDERLAPFPRTPEDTRRQLAQYYGMVSANDLQVGRMIAALEKSGQLENTLIVCTGDHGLAIGSHGLFGKQNVYEHSVRIPMILSGPGIRPGRTDAMIYNLDLFPTLCDLAGVEIPASVEGRSFRAVIDRPTDRFRDQTFHAYGMRGKMQRAIRHDHWKYQKYEVAGVLTRRLYDLKLDPDELHDLSTDPAAANELERLEKLLTQTQHDASDPILT